MALSLSPHQLQQVKHTPLLVSRKPLQSYSTPRQFTTVVHDNEVISIGSTESPSKSLSSSQVLPDLPSWTPLKILGEDEGSSNSDPEVDQLPAKLRATDSATKRFWKSPQVTVENAVTAAQSTSKPSSGAKPFKRARFDGVLITTKAPSYKKYSSQSKPPSTTLGTSLVDALARTFDANRHTEDLSTRPSRKGLYRHDDVPGALQTEVETSDPEEDLLELNSRLAHRPLKRPFSRINVTSANVSETNSEDVTPLRQDIPQSDRPIKRLKAIPYESNAAVIDAALGTVQAPISWDAETDFIARDDDFVINPAVHAAPSISVDDQTTVGEGDHTATPSRKVFLPSGHGGNERDMPTWGDPPKAVLSPYLSRGAKFRQRLDANFGENAAVRTDRNARPRRVEFDFFAFDEPDREPSPIPSESSVSVSPASTGEEGAIPSTHITSQSPDIPSADNIRVNQGQLEDGPVTKQVSVVGEEQMGAWISALQRLVKGKVHIGEEDLETLSIILAEIESLKDCLGDVPLTSELRESVKQLSELREIPFGDRNMLRQRAATIFHTWPSLTEVDVS